MLTIALDIDDVLIDTKKEFLKYLKITKNIEINFQNHLQYFTEDYLNCDKNKILEYIREFNDSSHHQRLKPKDATISTINKLAKHYRIIAVTSRERSQQSQTYDFIKSYFSKNINDVYFAKRENDGTIIECKSDICLEQRVDIIIEDDSSYIQRCAEKGIMVLIYNQPWNKNLICDKNVYRVGNWREIIQMLITTGMNKPNHDLSS